MINKMTQPLNVINWLIDEDFIKYVKEPESLTVSQKSKMRKRISADSENFGIAAYLLDHLEQIDGGFDKEDIKLLEDRIKRAIKA